MEGQLAINAVLVRGEPIGWVPFMSREGIVNGVFFALRLVVLYFSMLIVLSLVTPEAFAKVFSAAFGPISPRVSRHVALYVFLAIGFLPLFAEEFRWIDAAQRFRGGGLEGGLVRKISGARLLVVPLILSAIHRSGQLAMVVELRGLKGSIGDVLVFERPAAGDYLFAVTTVLVLGAALWAS